MLWACSVSRIIDALKILGGFFLGHAASSCHAAQLMEDGSIHPQAFLFQILLDGRTSCHLTAIDKADVLLSLVQEYLLFILWLSLCHQVEGRRCNKPGNEVWSNPELLKLFCILFIQLYLVRIVIILFRLFGKFGSAIRTLALSVGYDMPSVSSRIRCRDIQHPVSFYYIWSIVVELCICPV